MKLKTHNDKTINFSGTSLVGYLNASYDSIVKKLGKPMLSKDSKVRCSWFVELMHENKSIVATIYDYKAIYSNVKDHYDWHIGGRNDKALKLIKSLKIGKVKGFSVV